MTDIVKLQSIEAAVRKAENSVAVMEAQKKELENLLTEYGFDSVEELNSAIIGLESLLSEETNKLRDRILVLQQKMQDLYIE